MTLPPASSGATANVAGARPTSSYPAPVAGLREDVRLVRQRPDAHARDRADHRRVQRVQRVRDDRLRDAHAPELVAGGAGLARGLRRVVERDHEDVGADRRVDGDGRRSARDARVVRERHRGRAPRRRGSPRRRRSSSTAR